MKWVFEKQSRFNQNGLSSVPGPKSELHVCLSGGGFRAAFFHLGALLALAEERKLERVSMLATVSGGSIAAAFLFSELLKVSTNKDSITSSDFESCCVNAFKNLSTKISGNPRARAFSSIRALSRILVHNEFGFTRAMVRIYKTWLPSLIVKMETEKFSFLPEWRICTSNYNSGKRTVIIFNKKLNLTAGDSEYIDANNIGIFNSIAASAAVPLVFEPLRTENFQLGDGGILDNQGIRELSDENVESLCIDASAGLPDADKWISGVKTFGRSVDMMMEQLRTDTVDNWHGTTVGLRNSKKSVDKQSWYRAVKLLRTDLDDFTSVEADLLFLAGYQSVKGTCSYPIKDLFFDTRSIYDLVLASPSLRGKDGKILYKSVLKKLSDGKHTFGVEFRRFSLENLYALILRLHSVLTVIFLIGGYTVVLLSHLDSFLPNWILDLDEKWVYLIISILSAIFLWSCHHDASGLTSRKRKFFTFVRVLLLCPLLAILVFASRFLRLLPLLHSARRFLNFGLRSKIKKWSNNLVAPSI